MVRRSFLLIAALVTAGSSAPLESAEEPSVVYNEEYELLAPLAKGDEEFKDFTHKLSVDGDGGQASESFREASAPLRAWVKKHEDRRAKRLQILLPSKKDKRGTQTTPRAQCARACARIESDAAAAHACARACAVGLASAGTIGR